MNSNTIKSTLSAAALILVAATSVHAATGQVDETFVQGNAVPTKTVAYSRAELETDDGRAAVEQRIRKAADAVCGPRGYRDAGSLSAAAYNKACYQQAIAQAMTQIDAASIASISD